MKELQRIISIFFILFTTMVSAQEPSLILKGKVYDNESNNRLVRANIRLFDSEGNKLKLVTTDEQGQYIIELQTNSNRFKVEAQANDYNQAEVTVDSSKKNIEVDFGLTKSIDRNVKNELKHNFPEVYFDLNSSYLTVQAKEELKKVITYMKSNPKVKLRVNAHTDSRGTNSYNDWLSTRRAERVRNWLIQEGKIESNRIEEHHFGKSQLSNHCNDSTPCSAAQHRENRRCSFETVN